MKADFKATAEWRRHFAATACDGYQHAEAAKILDKLAATVDDVDEDLLGGYLQVCDGMLSSGFRLHEERLLRVGFHIWLDTATEFVQPDEDGLTSALGTGRRSIGSLRYRWARMVCRHFRRPCRRVHSPSPRRQHTAVQPRRVSPAKSKGTARTGWRFSPLAPTNASCF